MVIQAGSNTRIPLAKEPFLCFPTISLPLQVFFILQCLLGPFSSQAP
jgi:hypothetical protein